MATAKEIIASLNALTDDERTEAIRLLKNDAGDVVKAARDQMAGKAKKDGEKALETLRAQAADADSLEDILTIATAVGVPKEKIEAVRTVPDKAKVEKDVEAKFEKRLKKAEDDVKARDATILDLRRGSLKSKLVRELAEKHNVDPEYAEEVLASKFADRFAFGQDGTPDVLQPGATTAYDAESVDKKIELLAADIRKNVKPNYVRSNGDSGGGTQSGGGSGGGSGYDPVAEGKKMAEQQKQGGSGTAEREKSLAFR